MPTIPQSRPTPPPKPSNLVPPTYPQELLEDEKFGSYFRSTQLWMANLTRFLNALGDGSASSYRQAIANDAVFAHGIDANAPDSSDSIISGGSFGGRVNNPLSPVDSQALLPTQIFDKRQGKDIPSDDQNILANQVFARRDYP